VKSAALLDLDGTLVDSNYQHALAWYRAFRRHEIVLPIWRIHRHIGMGGDQLVAAITDQDVEQRLGDSLRAPAAEEFAPLRGECAPLAGAKDLIVELKRRDSSVLLASSSSEEDLEFFLELLDVKELVDGWTSKSDVERSKPDPDVVHAALEKAGTRDAVMIGDSRWDIEAASNAGLPTLALITGGWSEHELRQFGAASVYESLEALRAALDDTPLD
jgi:HAD superfamily hydrolase (TIGR01549 family)